jgi:tRNA modification GTPase
LAIVGRPNVGKSSLLNALLGHQRAIVTAIPGTTRDSLEEGLAIAGVAFRVIDTAGIRETADPVEALGVARSRALLATADVVMLVVDLSLGAGEVEAELRAAAGDRPLVVVGNKRDLVGPEALVGLRALAAGAPAVAVAALSGEGLPELERLLVEAALGMPPSGAAPTSINARHRACLEAARLGLARALASVRAGLPGDFWAIDLTAAAAGLAEVTGDALAEEVIEQVFARFCVGK